MHLSKEMQFALVIIISFLAGLLIMWLILRKNKKNQNYEALSHQFYQYQEQVNQFFIDSAKIIDELNQNYQKTIQNLNQNAQNLMSPKVYQEQCAKRQHKSITISYLAQNMAGATSENHTEHSQHTPANHFPLDDEGKPLFNRTPVIPPVILERHEFEDVEGMGTPPSDHIRDTDMEDDLRN